MRTRVLAGLIAAMLLSAVAASAATAFSRVPDGFNASLVDSFEALGSCSGTGASAVATDGTTHWVAIAGSLYRWSQGAWRGLGGEPWGIALADGTLWATQPGCDSSKADRVPSAPTECNLVRVSTENGKILETIGNVCGTGVAARGSELAVGTRDGRIVTVNVSTREVRPVPTPNLGRDVATQLAWAPDGGTIFFTRLRGTGLWSVPAAGGDLTRVATVAARGLIAGTTTTGSAGKVLVAGAGKLNLVKVDTGAATEVGAASSLAGPMAVAGKKILVAMTDEAWLLSGAFPGPAKPRAPRRPPAAVPPPAPPGTAQVAPPPPVLPQAPPPPVPPAPPAPVQAFIAQPSAVTNPALVPGKEDPEVALRHAATRRQPVASTVEVWLVWVVAATMIGGAGFMAGQNRRRRSPAWAVAGAYMTTRERHPFLR